MIKPDRVALLGYSGHAWVVCEALLATGKLPVGYYEPAQKEENPFNLEYLGRDRDIKVDDSSQLTFFPALGGNALRRKVTEHLIEKGLRLCDAVVHPTATLSPSARIGPAALVAMNVAVSTFAVVGTGAILNTGARVDHECRVGAYAHVAPGAILTGNVSVGEGAFVGAGAVVLPGINIGAGSTIGAGAVVLRDVPPGATVYGNPAKERK